MSSHVPSGEPPAPAPPSTGPGRVPGAAPGVPPGAVPGAASGVPPGAIGLLEQLRDELTAVRLPLTVAGALEARQQRQAVSQQLEDYVLPRYRSLDAPLLVVVCGSTGAGKSTLVNALVGRHVTRAGAVRPTTRQPLLVRHPDDVEWFTSTRVLPHLARSTAPSSTGAGGTGGAGSTSADVGRRGPVDPSASGTLGLADKPNLPRGLALLDAAQRDITLAVARDRVVVPVTAEIDRYGRFRMALAEASGRH